MAKDYLPTERRSGPLLVHPGKPVAAVGEQVLFELSTELTPSGDGEATSAEAYRLSWNADSNDWEADTDGETFTVWDLTGARWGKGRDDTNEILGSWGTAFLHKGSDRYVITQVQEIARDYNGIVTEDVTGGGPFIVNTVEPTDGGRYPPDILSDQDTLNVVNLHGWQTIDAGAKVQFKRNFAAGVYQAYQVTCAAEEE